MSIYKYQIDPKFVPMLYRSGIKSIDELAERSGLSIATVLWVLHPNAKHNSAWAWYAQFVFRSCEPNGASLVSPLFVAD